MLNKYHIFFAVLFPVIAATFFITLSENITFNDSVQADKSDLAGKGHFVVTVRDGGGNVKAVRQFENAWVNSGENCAAKMIFHDPTDAGNVVCTGATNTAWRYICLDEDPQVLTIDKDLRDPADEAGLSTCQWTKATWTQNSTASTDALSKVTATFEYTFTNSGASETIQALGMFNDTALSTRSMFAKGNFTSTTVNNGETITAQYIPEIGGGTVP